MRKKNTAAEQQYLFSTGSGKVDTILHTLFARVMSLEQWIQHMDKAGALASTLVTPTDAAGYVHLLKTTLIGIHEDGKELGQPVSLSQASHQREIILRAVQRVCQRDGLGKNVLTFGFAPMSDNPKASVSSVPNIEYRYPNSGVNRLQHSVWKTLLSRIGDLMMGYLLEDTSVFIRVVKPAVYLQLTGEAVYQAWPYSAGSTLKAKTANPKQQIVMQASRKSCLKRPLEDSEVSRNPAPPKRLRTEVFLSAYGVGKPFHSSVEHELNRGSDSSRGGQTSAGFQSYPSNELCQRGEIHEPACSVSEPSQRKSVPTLQQSHVESEQNSEVLEPSRHVSELGQSNILPRLQQSHVESEQQNSKIPGLPCFFQMPSCSKPEPELCHSKNMARWQERHAGSEQNQISEIPDPSCSASNLRLPGSQEPKDFVLCESRDVPKPQQSQALSEAHQNTESSVGEQGGTVEQQTISICSDLLLRHGKIARKSQQERDGLDHDPGSDTKSAISAKGKTVNKRKRRLTAPKDPPSETQNGDSALAETKKRRRKGKRQKEQKQEPCTVNIQPYWYHKYVPRLSLLYGKNLQEKFPNSFSLSTVEPTLDGARQLMMDIFMRTEVGGNMDSDQPCQCQGHVRKHLEKQDSQTVNTQPPRKSQLAGHQQCSQTGKDASTFQLGCEVVEHVDNVAADMSRGTTLKHENKRDGSAGSMESGEHYPAHGQPVTFDHGTLHSSSSGIPCGQVPSTNVASVSSLSLRFTGFSSSPYQDCLEWGTEKFTIPGDRVEKTATNSGCEENIQDPDTGVELSPTDAEQENEGKAFTVTSQPQTETSSYDADMSSTPSTEFHHSDQLLDSTCSNSGDTQSQHRVKRNTEYYKGDMSRPSSTLIVSSSQDAMRTVWLEPDDTKSSGSLLIYSSNTSDEAQETNGTFSSSSSSILTDQMQLRTDVLTESKESSQTNRVHVLLSYGDGMVLSGTETGTNAESHDVDIRQSSTLVSPDVIPPSFCSETLQAPVLKCFTLPPAHVRMNKSRESVELVGQCHSVHVSKNCEPVQPSSPYTRSGAPTVTCFPSYSQAGSTSVAVSNEGSSLYEISEFSSKSKCSLDGESSSSSRNYADTRSEGPQHHPSFYNVNSSDDRALACLSALKHDLVSGSNTEQVKLLAGRVFGVVSIGHGAEAQDTQSSQTKLAEAVSDNSGAYPGLFTSGAEEHILYLLQQLLQNHRKCPYRALLNYHCRGLAERKTSAVGNVHSHKKSKTFWNTCHLLEDVISCSQVFAFLRAVLVRTVPEQLYGHSTNKAVFLKNVRSLLSLGKFEKMCLGQLMRNVKVKRCGWLQGVSCQKEREHRMAQFIWWLLVYFVFHLIKTFFYSTDTTVFRNRVLFYRKRTWMKLQTKAMQEFRKSARLKYISEAEVNSLLEAKQSLGVSVIRFLPKAKSLRPIVNMSSKPKPEMPQIKSINKQLLKLLQALTFEKSADSSMCGCSVFGLDDIYTVFRDFVLQRTAQADTRPLYFVKTDVSKCFDCIQQQHLYNIIEDILLKDGEQTYITRKYACVVMTGQRLKRSFHMDTKCLSNFQPDFSSFVRQRAAGGRLHDCILVDQVLCQQDDTKSLLQLLSCHLFKNIIKVGHHHYLQQTGISQGSVVSSLLASIYLAHLEASHLSVAKDELLIRMMDDYLYLTPDRDRAEHFLTTTVKGFPDYNCFTNVNKVLTNFVCEHSALGVLQHVKPDEPFPWCGLLIDTTSLEISVDYSRYSGLCVTDTVSFDASLSPGLTLRNKLRVCLKPKCHVIFFDPQINSLEKILVNAYQVFLYLAQVFHTFVIRLPASQRVSNNTTFFCHTVQMIPQLLLTLVTRKLKHTQPSATFPVQRQVLQWLSADAFLVKLHKHAGYKQLKKFLRRSKMSVQRKLRPGDLAALREVHHTGVVLDSAVNML